MIILGVDPGTRITGYGLIQVDGSKIIALDYGCIRPPAQFPLAERYRIIFEGLEELIQRHQPESVAVELQFVLKNVSSAIKLGMAKAMAFLAAARKGIPVTEYAPTRAKQSVTGNGQASKWQVQRMIQTILHLPALPEPEDAADALALALCHAREKKKCMNQFEAPLKKKPQRQRLLNAMGFPIDSQHR